MKRMMFLLGLLVGAAHAEVRPFMNGSLQKIENERAGKPFILALWSATCTHCPAELSALGGLAAQYRGIDIVLIATDTPAEMAQLEKLATGYGLGAKSQWVFAEEQPERLRFEIDRRWHGELPRTYFFDAQHRRTAVSGIVPPEQLERWVADNVK